MNLSPKLVSRLLDVFPGSTHVRDIGMGTSNDPDIWEYARTNGFTIVTKDSDFHDVALVKGGPPKVIWLRCGNASTNTIEALLRSNEGAIKLFINKSQQACLQLFS